MAEEIIFNTKVNTGNSVKSVNDLDKSLEGVNSEINKINSNKIDSKAINEATKATQSLEKKMEELGAVAPASMREMTKTIKEYQAIALQAGETSAIGKEAILRAGEMKDRMIDIKEEMANVGRGEKHLMGVLEIGSGVVAGYGAVQSVMALTGNESEELQKSMQKLMAVTTLLNSVNQIRAMFERQAATMVTLNATRTAVATAGQYIYTTAVGTTTGAMKALRLAMLAIPLVAIIAGIMALVSAISWFTSEEETAEEANKALTASIEKQNEAFDRNSEKAKRNTQNKINLAKAEGASAEELHKLELDQLKENEALRKQETQMLSKQSKDKKDIYKKYLEEENWEKATEIRKEIEATRGKYKDLKALDGQYFVDKKILELNEKKRLEDEAKKTEEKAQQTAQQNADKWKQAQEKRKAEEERIRKEKIERDRLLSDLVVANIEDENLRVRATMDIAHQRQREDLIAKYGQDKELLKQLETQQATEIQAHNQTLIDARKADQEQIDQAEKDAKIAKAEEARREEVAQLELQLMQMAEDNEMRMQVQRELDALNMEEELANVDLTESEKEIIREKYRQQDLEREKEAKQQKIDMAKEIATSSLDIASSLMSSMQSISDSIYETQLNGVEKGSQAELAIKKKQFESNKKMQIANAIISGIQGALTAFTGAMQLGPIAGPIVGGVLAGVVGVTTALNVKKIKSTKFDGGGGSGGGSAPSVSMPSIPSASEVAGGQNEGTSTAGLAGSGTENVPEPMQPKIVVEANIVDDKLKAGLDKYDKSQSTSSFQ
jgi:hypothetical protein